MGKLPEKVAPWHDTQKYFVCQLLFKLLTKTLGEEEDREEVLAKCRKVYEQPFFEESQEVQFWRRNTEVTLEFVN